MQLCNDEPKANFPNAFSTFSSSNHNHNFMERWMKEEKLPFFKFLQLGGQITFYASLNYNNCFKQSEAWQS